MAEPTIRAEVEAAVEQAFQRLGPTGFKKADVISQFSSHGMSPATLYRWIDAYLEKSKPGPRLVKAVKVSAARAAKEAVKRAAKTADTRATRQKILRSPKGRTDRAAAIVEIADGELTKASPAVGGAVIGPEAIDVIARLKQCLEIGEQLVAFARTEDGKVKMSRTLLHASEHIRRTVETLVKMHEAIHSVSRVDAFHRDVIALLEDVAREHPPAAQTILVRLRGLTAQWSL